MTNRSSIRFSGHLLKKVFEEYSCQFGESNRLNGIVTVPDSENFSRIALILITAGFTPKTGPFRLYTLIARKAAANKLVSMRFDLGGIGNSEQLDPGKPLSVRTENDIRQAIGYLRDNYGIEKFVLGGLCSGAEDSFKYAHDHENINGVILIDAHAYKTWDYRLRFLISRKFFNRIGRTILSQIGLLKLVHNSSESSLEGDQGGLVDYQQLNVEEASNIMTKLIDQQIKLLYIFTGGMNDKFNHPKQFNRMFPNIDFKNLVTVAYLPHMGHVQIFEEDRNELCGVIDKWLELNFK